MSVAAPVHPETAELAGLLDRLRELTAAGGRPDLADRIGRARDRVTRPRMRVIVTGETGQGMSALVDALAGRPVTGARPTRPVVVDDGDGLVLVDTPGIFGADSGRAAAALAHVAGADAVLFVSDAGRELTEPEITYLSQLRMLCPTVVGVVTKIDRHPRWTDIQRADRRHLTEAGVDIPLFPVSSAMLARARGTGDDALAVESGIPQLADHLRDTVLTHAAQIRHAGVVNDVRVVSDQVALALNAELDALRDPTAGSDDRLTAARTAATRLRERSANWQTVLADGATELGADVDHDLRHRLRELVGEAETDIDRSDPVKRWDEFGAWVNGRVEECVRANAVLAETRSRALAVRVAAKFADDAPLPALTVDSSAGLEPVRPLKDLDSRKAGIVQRVISSIRGSYGGILMVGLMTSLAGLALVNPWSIGAGLVLGANTFREDRKARTARRQAEAKIAVARLMDDVIFQVGRESRFRLREVQRTLRDHFTALADEMARTADDALRAADDARRTAVERRDARTARIEHLLAELRSLRVRVAPVTPFDAARQFLGDSPVDACLARLRAPLRIALSGTLKSGKSTLLNALVGAEVAATDATECTRVVTTYRYAATPVAEIVHDGGRRTVVPPAAVGGTNLVPEEIEIGLPSRLLAGWTLVDTPGTSSTTRDVSARTLAYLDPDDGVCAADAVVHLMVTLHDADLALLRRVQAQSGRGGPLGVVGVLSRADEGAPPVDRADPRYDALPHHLVPVSGLLALRGRTLRPREYSVLRGLAGRPAAELDGMLVSPERFRAGCPDEELLDRFGMTGIATAIDLIHRGATTAPLLAAALVARSGLDELHRVLDARIGQRAHVLRRRAALVELRRGLGGIPAAARLVAGIERELADDHALVELRMLGLLPGLPHLPWATRAALDRVLGGSGTAAAARLGLPEGTGAAALTTAAIRAAGYWRTRLDEPLLDPGSRRVVRAAVRSCEAIAAAGWDGRLVRRVVHEHAA